MNERSDRAKEERGDQHDEICYCGTRMVQIQTCKYQCMNCGAILDCEDVQGLPK